MLPIEIVERAIEEHPARHRALLVLNRLVLRRGIELVQTKLYVVGARGRSRHGG